MNPKIKLLISIIGLFTLSSFSDAGWLTERKDHFYVYYQPGDEKNARKIVRVLESSLAKIEEDVGQRLTENVRVYLAPSQIEFSQLTGGRVPHWGGGVTIFPAGVIVLKSPRFDRPEHRVDQIAVHELTHLLLGLTLKGRPVPLWFNEGLAQFESGEWRLRSKVLLSRALLTKSLLSLDEIEGILRFNRPKAALAYLESLSAVEFLVERYGRRILPGIIAGLKLGQGMEDIFSQKLGMSLADFEREWAGFLKEKYRWYVLLGMDFEYYLYFIILLLFILGALVMRRRKRRILARWDSEEEFLDDNFSEY